MRMGGATSSWRLSAGPPFARDIYPSYQIRQSEERSLFFFQFDVRVWYKEGVYIHVINKWAERCTGETISVGNSTASPEVAARRSGRKVAMQKRGCYSSLSDFYSGKICLRYALRYVVFHPLQHISILSSHCRERKATLTTLAKMMVRSCGVLACLNIWK